MKLKQIEWPYIKLRKLIMTDLFDGDYLHMLILSEVPGLYIYEALYFILS